MPKPIILVPDGTVVALLGSPTVTVVRVPTNVEEVAAVRASLEAGGDSAAVTAFDQFLDAASPTSHTTSLDYVQSRCATISDGSYKTQVELSLTERVYLLERLELAQEAGVGAPDVDLEGLVDRIRHWSIGRSSLDLGDSLSLTQE